MRLWFPVGVDDAPCLLAIQRWLDAHDYWYPQRLQDAVNARFHSYDKRPACVDVVDGKARLWKPAPPQYAVVADQHGLIVVSSNN